MSISLFEYLVVGELALLIFLVWLGVGDLAGIQRLLTQIRDGQPIDKSRWPVDPHRMDE